MQTMKEHTHEGDMKANTSKSMKSGLIERAALRPLHQLTSVGIVRRSHTSQALKHFILDTCSRKFRLQYLFSSFLTPTCFIHKYCTVWYHYYLTNTCPYEHCWFTLFLEEGTPTLSTDHFLPLGQGLIPYAAVVPSTACLRCYHLQTTATDNTNTG